MAQQYRVEHRGKLLEFLFAHLDGWSKKGIKQRLKGSSVAVNGVITTKHDHIVDSGDVVEVGSVQRTRDYLQTPPRLEIIYQDSDLVAINKPAGLLSVGTTRETKQHALALLRTQLSRGKDSIKLWPVHRLDRDTSGILLFATSKEMREAVMSHWSDAEKIYLAVVQGTPQQSSATINQPLRLDESSEHYSLLEVRIETGRQHQIRAHMSWLGHAVVGDERYGTKGSRMGLHAMKLSITHPTTKRQLTLEVDAPRDLDALLHRG